MTKLDTKEETRYREGYTDGQATGTNNNTVIGLIIGLLIASCLGLGAWFLISQGSQPETDGADPFANPVPEGSSNNPDININVPRSEGEAPEFQVPELEVPGTNPNPDAPTNSDPAVPSESVVPDSSLAPDGSLVPDAASPEGIAPEGPEAIAPTIPNENETTGIGATEPGN